MRFNKLIPELGVIDFDKSINFYVEIVGFKMEYFRGDGKQEHRFALISMQGSQLMIDEITDPGSKDDRFITAKLEYPFGRGINFQIMVENADSILSRLEKNRYPIHMGLKENWYRQDDQLLGNKEFMVLDPDGYLLRFAEDLGTKPL
ncbi:VOC family protein [Candidatus Woesearchaeota archaeon]|nr:VOC family protein [Candidatus Woesearchaeota archaeon]